MITEEKCMCVRRKKGYVQKEMITLHESLLQRFCLFSFWYSLKYLGTSSGDMKESNKSSNWSTSKSVCFELNYTLANILYDLCYWFSYPKFLLHIFCIALWPHFVLSPSCLKGASFHFFLCIFTDSRGRKDQYFNPFLHCRRTVQR